jgi:hypothetical protein
MILVALMLMMAAEGFLLAHHYFGEIFQTLKKMRDTDSDRRDR